MAISASQRQARRDGFEVVDSVFTEGIVPQGFAMEHAVSLPPTNIPSPDADTFSHPCQKSRLSVTDLRSAITFIAARFLTCGGAGAHVLSARTLASTACRIVSPGVKYKHHDPNSFRNNSPAYRRNDREDTP
jgi:hypothetical protein